MQVEDELRGYLGPIKGILSMSAAPRAAGAIFGEK